MKPKLYLETTIPSYLTAKLSRDLIIAGHQQITQEWWRKREDDFELYISLFVKDEVTAGDLNAASARLDIIKNIPALELTSDVEALTQALLTSRILPAKAATDAAHIAISAVHGMEFLMTWNCAHLANAFIAKSVIKDCNGFGYACPIICTPEELLGE